jgi:glycosyltransferase involved in cell wall biosynthesis
MSRDLPQHVRMAEAVFKRASEFDVIHFHCDYVHLPLVRQNARPTVTTLHGYVNSHDLTDLLLEYKDVPLVSISNAQRASVPDANWVGTVYHGLPPSSRNFRAQRGKYLAFLGRVSPEKGLERAIEISRLTRMPLKIAAKIYDEDRRYYERVICPLLQACSTCVEFIGGVGGTKKDEFLGNARALLFPVEWPEPFGLVMIEAMACGTPVIAWKRGSVPEIMQDGVNGFVVESVEEAIGCISRLDTIRRGKCRQIFEERFSSRRMTLDYLRIYEQMIDAS